MAGKLERGLGNAPARYVRTGAKPGTHPWVNGGSHILSLTKVEPSLEDVFIEPVGHGLRAQGVDA